MEQEKFTVKERTKVKKGKGSVCVGQLMEVL
jgi:hypothetical protein